MSKFTTTAIEATYLIFFLQGIRVRSAWSTMSGGVVPWLMLIRTLKASQQPTSRSALTCAALTPIVSRAHSSVLLPRTPLFPRACLPWLDW